MLVKRSIRKKHDILAVMASNRLPLLVYSCNMGLQCNLGKEEHVRTGTTLQARSLGITVLEGSEVLIKLGLTLEERSRAANASELRFLQVTNRAKLRQVINVFKSCLAGIAAMQMRLLRVWSDVRRTIELLSALCARNSVDFLVVLRKCQFGLEAP